MKNKKRFQTKLILAFLVATIIIFGVNFYLFVNMNRVITKVDRVYSGNTSLNELQSTLKKVQTNLSDYLNTGSSDSMENYYIYYEEYNILFSALNSKNYDDEQLMLEKNIRNLSNSYLALTEEAIDNKRGRRVDKYKASYETALELYEYLDAYIYSLNNLRFSKNSQSYSNIVMVLRNAQFINLFVLGLTSGISIIIAIAMTQGITKSEIKEKELMMEAHLKDAQLKYLQAQINPHFLFNTLNAGTQLAMMEGADRTYEYVQKTAEFFRYTVKTKLEKVSLEEELKLIDNYIYILNVRFSGEIHYDTKIETSIDDIFIPAMTIQPIVENSVNHGIRNIDWEGKITLHIYEEKDDICVSIEDNGVGMEQEQIETLLENKKFSGNTADSNGVAMGNVINRLRLFYGKEDVLDITSDGKNMGTKVILHIPQNLRGGIENV